MNVIIFLSLAYSLASVAVYFYILCRQFEKFSENKFLERDFFFLNVEKEIR